MSSPVLQPLPRKVTPVDMAATNVHAHQPWDSNEATVQATVRAYPEAMARGAPVLPRPERAVGPKAQLRMAASAKTDEVRGESKVLKVLTVLLVLVALGLAGVYYAVSSRKTEPADEVVVHPNAPVPNKRPLYEREVAVDKRDVDGAATLAVDGDRAHSRGELTRAADFYRAAFEKDPNPELSLKLGEVLYRSGHTDEARQWWQRHLRDEAGSKARHYIQETLGEAGSP